MPRMGRSRIFLPSSRAIEPAAPVFANGIGNGQTMIFRGNPEGQFFLDLSMEMTGKGEDEVIGNKEGKSPALPFFSDFFRKGAGIGQVGFGPHFSG